MLPVNKDSSKKREKKDTHVKLVKLPSRMVSETKLKFEQYDIRKLKVLFLPRHLEVKVEHYFLLMFSPLLIKYIVGKT